MLETSFDLTAHDNPIRLDQVIAEVVARYSNRDPGRLDMIRVRSVWVDGELRKRVSSPSTALVNDIRDRLSGVGGLCV